MAVTSGQLYESLREYEKDNYYLKDEAGNPLEPQKVGNAWAELEKTGQIKINEEAYRDLKAGIDPNTKQQMAQDGVNGEHRAGMNFTFSPDKSWTVYAGTSDQAKAEVMEIHGKAMGDVVKYMEENLVQARVTQNGVTEPVKTNSMLAFRQDHFVSNAGDLQIHSHLGMFNETYNSQTSKWQAVHNDALHSDVLQKLYENGLAFYAREKGLAVGWKSSDTSKSEYATLKGGEAMDKAVPATSTRSILIDKTYEENKAVLHEKYPDKTVGDIKQQITNETRKDKVSLTKEQIDGQFIREINSVGVGKEDIANGVHKEAAMEKERSTENTKMNAYEIVEATKGGLSENHSTFSESQLLKEASVLSKGDASLPQLREAVASMAKDKDLAHLGEHTVQQSKGGSRGREYNDRVYTSTENLRDEKFIDKNIKDTNGKHEPIMTREAARAGMDSIEKQRQKEDPNFKFTADQINMGEHALSNRNGVAATVGDAGTGKTAAVKAVAELAKENGYTVRGITAEGKAAKVLENEGGIKSETSHQFLNGFHEKVAAERGGKSPQDLTKPNQVWFVDEFSKMGTQKTAELMRAANEVGARIYAVGDFKQQGSIAAGQGRAWSQAIENGSLEHVRMSENIRQRSNPEYQKAMRELADKKIDKAIDRLIANSKVHEIPERAARMAAIGEKFKEMKAPHTVTDRIADKNELNRIHREGLKAEGKIKGPEYTFTVRQNQNITGQAKLNAENYNKGDIIHTHNMPGIKNGEKGELRITSVDKSAGTITGMNKDKDGQEQTIDVRRNGKNISGVYRERQISVAKGDSLEGGKNDKGLGINNGDGGMKVLKIDEKGNMLVKTETGEKKDINVKAYPYLDHDYAGSKCKSQGGTWGQAIVHSDTQHHSNFQAEYVAGSRGKTDMHVYTDNIAKWREQVKSEVQAKLATEFEKANNKETKEGKAIGQEAAKLEKEVPEVSKDGKHGNTETPEKHAQGKSYETGHESTHETVRQPSETGGKSHDSAHETGKSGHDSHGKSDSHNEGKADNHDNKESGKDSGRDSSDQGAEQER